MSWKSALCGVLAAFFTVSCSDKEKPAEPEQSVTLDFKVTDIVMSAGIESEVSLAVTPAEKAAAVEFSVADEEIVTIKEKTVTEDGVTLVLAPEALGTTTVAAVLGDCISVCNVSVSPVEVTSVTLDNETLKLPVGGSSTLKVTLAPVNATNPKVTWTTSDEKVAVVSHGKVTGLSSGKAVITASVGDMSAECEVEVYSIDATSLDIDVTSREIAVGETFVVTATVLPENVTDKSFHWSADAEGIISYEVIDAVEGDNVIAARVSGIGAGNAVLTVSSGTLKAECRVAVRSADIPESDPKVGDYYYSDGTWSDGGLLSINADGTDPVWKSVKPAPVDGKTVIGIVFQTDASRISDTEKAAGHTHGLVMAIRSAHSQKDSLTRYSLVSDFDHIPNKKLGTAWYADINGYDWTEAIKSDYPGTNIQQCPAFDWTVTDFSPSAPVGTSGWYVPSIGQVWDLLANLGGNEMAQHLKTLRTYSSDISYYYREPKLTLTYDPIAELNSTMALVPDSMKENLKISGKRGSSNLCELMSSSLYDNSDGAVCVFWLYDSGQLEPTCDWTDQTYVCRPVLSF